MNTQNQMVNQYHGDDVNLQEDANLVKLRRRMQVVDRALWKVEKSCGYIGRQDLADRMDELDGIIVSIWRQLFPDEPIG
jgi:hypothetical protein